MPLLEAFLLLSAEMEDCLGLQFPMQPHGKTAAQLYRCASEILEGENDCIELIRKASKYGRIEMVDWLLSNAPPDDRDDMRVGAIEAAIAAGQLALLKWLAPHQEV